MITLREANRRWIKLDAADGHTCPEVLAVIARQFGRQAAHCAANANEYENARMWARCAAEAWAAALANKPDAALRREAQATIGDWARWRPDGHLALAR